MYIKEINDRKAYKILDSIPSTEKKEQNLGDELLQNMKIQDRDWGSSLVCRVRRDKPGMVVHEGRS